MKDENLLRCKLFRPLCRPWLGKSQFEGAIVTYWLYSPSVSIVAISMRPSYGMLLEVSVVVWLPLSVR